MPIKTTWLIDQRIVYQRFYGDVTVEEFAASVKEIQQFIESSSLLVHGIGDLSEVQKYPSLLQLSKVAQRNHHFKNLGWTVLVVTNPLLRFFGSVLAQFTVERLRTVSTMQEALEFIASRDQNISIAGISESENPDDR
ncbi:MAG TPA: hypothetical protein VHL11_22095 [Phototrophicaceae bacterium]|jgi:hypothetical protein|nr:hypothetical protein [Phototrophicaceae bacterium]